MAHDEFFIHVSDTPKRLYDSRRREKTSTALSPCDMTPEDVDYEMSTGKNPEILEIVGMNQKSLEHFCANYGGSYRYLSFFKCQKIQDYSPLEDLQKLEYVNIYWNIRADRLWNFSRNRSLTRLEIRDCKKITRNPILLDTSPTLARLRICGSVFENYPMENLDIFGQMSALRHLELRHIKLSDKRMDFLRESKTLERFDFDAGMLTTEEIAWIVAKYPHLSGSALCAYNTIDALLNDVRVCGFRKPGLDLPEGQKRLDKYIAQFDALVEKYRNEP